MVENFLKLEMTSRPDNVGVCRLAIAHFAGLLGFTMAEIEELKVAVSEAVTNAVIHGYGGGPGVVTMVAESRQGGLSIEVRDEGVGIPDIAKARQPSYSQDPERMGLGFVFMESFTDELVVESTVGRGTRVLMVKLREDMRQEEAQ